MGIPTKMEENHCVIANVFTADEINVKIN